MNELYLLVDHVHISKVKNVDPKRAIRLYCTRAGSHWNLQVRGLLSKANGHDGKDFVVASAELSKDDLRELRNVIDGLLKDE